MSLVLFCFLSFVVGLCVLFFSCVGLGFVNRLLSGFLGLACFRLLLLLSDFGLRV